MQRLLDQGFWLEAPHRGVERVGGLDRPLDLAYPRPRARGPTVVLLVQFGRIIVSDRATEFFVLTWYIVDAWHCKADGPNPTWSICSAKRKEESCMSSE